jgi:hypothetical protein
MITPCRLAESVVCDSVNRAPEYRRTTSGLRFDSSSPHSAPGLSIDAFGMPMPLYADRGPTGCIV